MINDSTLLRIFLKRDTYETYSNLVKLSALTPEAKVVFKDLKVYFDSFEGEQIDLNQFRIWFHQIQHPEINDNKHSVYAALFDTLSNTEIEDSKEFIEKTLNHFKERLLRKRIEEELAGNGDLEVIQNILEENVIDSESQNQNIPVENSVKNILAKTKRTHGLTWSLKCLNASIGPIIGGDFGCIAALVESGKTCMVVSQTAHMARQLTEGKVLFFNNESTEEVVMSRLWCNVLDCTIDEIRAYPEECEKEYIKRMNGDLNRVLFFEAHQITTTSIIAKARKYNAKLIVIDTLDDLGYNSDNEVLRVRGLYQSIRRAAKLCNVPIIGTTQCKATAIYKKKEDDYSENHFKRYIGWNELDQSTIGKPSTFDFLITMGKDAAYPNIRYIHTPKNKLPGDGIEHHRYIKREIDADWPRSKYVDRQR